MKKIIQYFSLISLCVFLLGYGYQNGYYSQFDINIESYMSNSEFFYTFLPLAFGFLAFGQSFLHGWFSDLPKKEVPPAISSEEKDEDPLPENETEKTRKFPWFLRIPFLICMLILSLLAQWLIIELPPFRAYPHIKVGLLFLTLLILGIRYLIDAIINDSPPGIFIMIAYIGISYLTIEFGKAKAVIVKSMGAEINYTFSYKGQRVTTNDSSLIFVGQTQTHMMLYKPADKVAWSVPTSDVDSLYIHILEDTKLRPFSKKKRKAKVVPATQDSILSIHDRER